MNDFIIKIRNEERLCRIWIQDEAGGRFEPELIRIGDDSALIKQDGNCLAGSVMNCQYYLRVKDIMGEILFRIAKLVLIKKPCPSKHVVIVNRRYRSLHNCHSEAHLKVSFIAG
jgi:hypothetical protein